MVCIGNMRITLIFLKLFLIWDEGMAISVHVSCVFCSSETKYIKPFYNNYCFIFYETVQ